MAAATPAAQLCPINGDDFDAGATPEGIRVDIAVVAYDDAGFYGELSMAKVDGFGSDTKLSVGTTTWFAGVNFEF